MLPSFPGLKDDGFSKGLELYPAALRWRRGQFEDCSLNVTASRRFRKPQLIHTSPSQHEFSPYAGTQPEEVARKLRAACMKDEGSAHSEDATEKTGFEDDIVSRRSLTGSRGRGCGRAGCRPVVPSECECG